MRPPAARVHDQLWSGPIGRGRRAQFRLEQPDHRCAACHRWELDPHVHHLSYKYFTGMEPPHLFRYLCPWHHRRVHRWHDRIFPHDRWPYRWLGITTRWYIRLYAPYRWLTWGQA